MIKYNVLDLFCGAGGLSCGFERAGFNIVLGIDNDTILLFRYPSHMLRAMSRILSLMISFTFSIISRNL